MFLTRPAFGPGRVIRALCCFLLILWTAAPVVAAPQAVVAAGDNHDYFQYSYSELLDSYALELLDHPDGLYEHFRTRQPRAILSSDGRYIDYNGILDRYSREVVRGRLFCLNSYLASDMASRAFLPDLLISVSQKEGAMVKSDLIIGPRGPAGGGGDGAIPPSLPGSGTGTPASDEIGRSSAGDAGQELLPQPKPARDNTSQQDAGVEAGGDENDESRGQGAGEESGEEGTPILGPAQVSKEQAISWARKNRAAPVFIELASHYWSYGRETGIRPEVLYAQAALESGFGRFGGIVPPHHNNWAGIKAAGATGETADDYERFSTPSEGARGHFNHMAAYVGVPPVGVPHGRYYSVLSFSWAGTVKTVEDLTGRWAVSATYHQRIVSMLEEMAGP